MYLKRLTTPKSLTLISLLMLVIILVFSGLLLNSLENNEFLRGILINLFENDPKVQRNMINGELAASSIAFVNEVIHFIKEISIYPIYMLGIATLFSLLGFLTIKINKFAAATFLSLAGVLSIFTLVPPILLFFASSNLFKKQAE